MTKSELNARDVATDVTTGQTTAVEIARAALDRIEAAATLNAVVTIDRAQTLADAAAVDRRRAAGETMLLAGVPIVIKDNIWVGGWRVTQGSRLFANFVAPQDAIAIAWLRKAGAVIVGIGATSEFACKGVTTSPLFGPTRHPLNPGLTPGGSSGGPATAVAAGLVPLAIGTDAGGSSRRPPAHVGVVGFKPSYGAIPYGPGFAEPFFCLSVIAPIAATVAEVALAFESMVGLDQRDPDSAVIATDDGDELGDLRIAYTPRLGLDVAVDQVVADGLASAIGRLSAAGLGIVYRDPAWPRGATEEAIMPLQHVGLAALYGDAFRQDPTVFDPDIAKQIERGLSWTGAEVGAALGASAAIANTFAAFLCDVDLPLTPTVPCVAWPLTQPGPTTVGGRATGPRGHAVFTPFVNRARVPAISIPCGTNPAGLPFGLQIIARRGRDRTLLRAATQIEASLQAARAAGIIGADVFTGKKVRGRAQPMNKKAWAAKFKKYAVLAGVNEPKKSCHGVRKARAEVAAYADCTESQMMAMFGWTDPKMPAHYIAQANREKLGMTGMEKIVAFDQSQSSDDLAALPHANGTGTSGENRVVTLRSKSAKKESQFQS